MKTVIDSKEYLYQINGSKFIAIPYFVTNNQEVKDILKNVKEQNKKAKHICYAYKIDDYKKFDDNKEPSGSAGKKILDVIDLNNLNHILIVIIRYMSGTKLGIGLLTRSYFNSANKVIEDTNNLCNLNQYNVYQIKLEFNQLNITIGQLKKYHQKILEEFNDDNYCYLIAAIEDRYLNEFKNVTFIKKQYLKEN